MKRTTKAALAVGIPAAAALQFYDYAFGRSAPAWIRAVRRHSPGGTHSSRYYLQRDASTALAGATAHQTFTLRSERGSVMQAYLWQAGEKPARTVAFLVHGFRSSAKETVGPFLSCYRSRGIDVFACDLEAAGASEGRYFSYDYFESRACLQWMEFLIDRYGSDVRILLHGFSMGAATVLHLSDRCPPQVRFLVSDCGYTSGPEILLYQCEGHAAPCSLLCAMNRLVSGFDLKETDVRPHLCRTDKPVLFVHGTDDPTVPYSMGRELYDLCPTPKAMLTVEGGRHVESIFRAGAAYEAHLDAFLDRFASPES